MNKGDGFGPLQSALMHGCWYAARLAARCAQGVPDDVVKLVDALHQQLGDNGVPPGPLGEIVTHAVTSGLLMLVDDASRHLDVKARERLARPSAQAPGKSATLRVGLLEASSYRR